MKYPLFAAFIALTFASCSNKDTQYNWVCTSDSTYYNAQGLQHATKSTTVRFKTKSEIKVVEKQMCKQCSDSTRGDVSCKK